MQITSSTKLKDNILKQKINDVVGCSNSLKTKIALLQKFIFLTNKSVIYVNILFQLLTFLYKFIGRTKEFLACSDFDI